MKDQMHPDCPKCQTEFTIYSCTLERYLCTRCDVLTITKMIKDKRTETFRCSYCDELRESEGSQYTPPVWLDGDWGGVVVCVCADCVEKVGAQNA